MKVWMKSGHVFEVVGTDSDQADLLMAITAAIRDPENHDPLVDLPLSPGPDARVLVSQIEAFSNNPH